MRIPVIAGGVALCAGMFLGALILTAPVRASAQTEVVTLLHSNLSSSHTTDDDKTDSSDVLKEAVDSVIESSEKKDSQIPEDEEKTHVVVKGESLESIAKKYKIDDWTRLFYKNTDLEDPNFLEVGHVLVIPNNEEILEKRDLPIAPTVVETTQTNQSNVSASSERSVSTQVRSSTKKTSVASTSAGNRYSYGYCTWYVKNMRPDLPNNLGSANTWYSRAAAQGFATGYSPQVGAVAEALTGYMHVAYVTAVHGDGTITVSEMNFNGWNQVSSRRVAASQFRYIY